MNDDQKIHLLVQELIPIMAELDDEPKQILLGHIQSCEKCQELYRNASEFDDSMPTLEYRDHVELKPLKKLAQYNIGLKLGLVAIRGIILFYLLYASFNMYEGASVDFDFLRGGLFLFYIPAAIFLLIFTFTFFNKKWLFLSLLADLLVILLLSKILQLFF